MYPAIVSIIQLLGAMLRVDTVATTSTFAQVFLFVNDIFVSYFLQLTLVVNHLVSVNGIQFVVMMRVLGITILQDP